MSARDWMTYVQCNLPGCTTPRVRRTHAVPVSVIFDGHRLRGLACSPDHAAEISRGWSSRDAYGAEFVPTTTTRKDVPA